MRNKIFSILQVVVAWYRLLWPLGYAFQIQMKFIGYKLGFKIKEIPIIFKDREIGESKMSINIFYEAFFGILGMKIKSLLFPLKS